jgi:hypothetical protein
MSLDDILSAPYWMHISSFLGHTYITVAIPWFHKNHIWVYQQKHLIPMRYHIEVVAEGYCFIVRGINISSDRMF